MTDELLEMFQSWRWLRLLVFGALIGVCVWWENWQLAGILAGVWAVYEIFLYVMRRLRMD
ncbi:MAG: hypothetical protein VX871_05840 [Pseudomonadota bacterium]|nr:hypothetical protein [Pseudomonadota bacterium]